MLMRIRIRIRILDPHWEKWIWIQVISLRFTEFFFKKIIFKLFVLFFSLVFILTLDKPFKDEEIFIISLFSKVQNQGLGVKKFCFCSFWLIFYPLDPDPWIHIFLSIRIQEAKILRIQRIRILSTVNNYIYILAKIIKYKISVSY